jgi:hypothetical protein
MQHHSSASVSLPLALVLPRRLLSLFPSLISTNKHVAYWRAALHVNSLRLAAQLHHCYLLARLGPPHWPAPGRAQMSGSATANTPPSHPEAGFFIYDSVFPSRDPFLTITAFFKNHSFPVLSPSHSLQTHSLSSHSLKLIHFNQQSTCKVLLSWEPLPGWRTPGRTPTAYVFLFL